MHTTIAISGVLPAWLVIPSAVLVMLTVAAAITVTAKHTTPASRRRVRLANGWVMLLLIPLAATGFSLIDSAQQPRLFVQIWILVIGLISISVVLAIMDVLNTARLARLAHQRLRTSMRLTADTAQSIAESKSNEPIALRLADENETPDGAHHD